MQQDFWLNCWQKERIGFHQDELQPFLLEYFPKMADSPIGPVFVPLCGKTSDLLYFSKQLKTQVVGSELSEIACEDFFKENHLTVHTEKQGDFICHQTDNLSILQGDFFALNPETLPKFDWIYDRAAIIALPLEMRRQYAQKLKTFFSDHTRLFLITLEFDQNEMPGPPFSVAQADLETLFSEFKIEKVAERDLTGKKFARIQLDVGNLSECLYIISKP